MPATKANLDDEFDPARRAPKAFTPVEWEKITIMLDELPPGMPILPPEDQGNFSKYRHRPARVYSKGAAWQNCADALETHDAELCKAYREEIDTLLVFAGLFSAVVTAFSVESYQWLQDDPTDAIIALLSQIERSISQNGTSGAIIAQSSSGIPGGVSARINAYWFLSLSLSLVTALVAILGKQWVREFERHAAMSPREFVGVRQMKFEGLQYWKVGDIISMLPLLLQLSLAVFALGIIKLLWRLHTGVAITVCVPASIALLFYLSTTLLPVFQFHRLKGDVPALHNVFQCSYKSPQAWLAMRTYRAVPQGWLRLRASLLRCICLSGDARKHPAFEDSINSWSDWDRDLNSDQNYGWLNGPASHFRGLSWLGKHMDQSDAKEWIWHCLWDEATEKGTELVSTKLQAGVAHVLDSANGGEEDQGHSQASPPSLVLLYLHHTNMSREFVAEASITLLSTALAIH
ncbi:hypothetical protein AURDEDRAFT_166691 [Auricularia subglabra TFB-10046 SS5]|nr:hypothetical protein AURDEDRAFT_166691 [Auricularia subglabra TFB-10046 SS5]